MCTALVALSLVPLTGWAGQVSLAPLAFAGIGAVAYARLGGAHGSIWAVFLAALVTVPVGALFAFPAMRLQGLYLALATLAFAAMVEEVFFAQPFAVGAGERSPSRRCTSLGVDFSRAASRSCSWSPSCSGCAGSASSRSGAARSGGDSSRSATAKPRR